MDVAQGAQIALHDANVGANSQVAAMLPESPTRGSKEDVLLTFVTYDGKEMNVSASEGSNLMEVAKAAGLPSIEGVCGGQLECATCHVYLAGTSPLAPASENEEDMLAYAIGRRDESRLGCQIEVTKELTEWVKQGGRIGLPRY